jgi:hypothetical protein
MTIRVRAKVMDMTMAVMAPAKAKPMVTTKATTTTEVATMVGMEMGVIAMALVVMAQAIIAGTLVMLVAESKLGPGVITTLNLIITIISVIVATWTITVICPRLISWKDGVRRINNMFEELIARVRRRQAEFEFELARTEDPYRLFHLLDSHRHTMLVFSIDAKNMVRELEEI